MTVPAVTGTAVTVPAVTWDGGDHLAVTVQAVTVSVVAVPAVTGTAVTGTAVTGTAWMITHCLTVSTLDSNTCACKALRV